MQSPSSARAGRLPLSSSASLEGLSPFGDVAARGPEAPEGAREPKLSGRRRGSREPSPTQRAGSGCRRPGGRGRSADRRCATRRRAAPRRRRSSRRAAGGRPRARPSARAPRARTRGSSRASRNAAPRRQSARWRRRLFSTSDPSPSSTSIPRSLHSASAASSRDPPTNTPSRANSAFSSDSSRS